MIPASITLTPAPCLLNSRSRNNHCGLLLEQQADFNELPTSLPKNVKIVLVNFASDFSERD